MSMELSTPFLNYYVFFRTRYPYSSDVTTSRTLFCYTFVAARVLLNSAGAALFLQQVIHVSELYSLVLCCADLCLTVLCASDAYCAVPIYGCSVYVRLMY